MEKYEILIGNKSQPEAHRYNKGDILAVVPWKRKSTKEVDHYTEEMRHGELHTNVPVMKDIDEAWNWGKEEIKRGLVVNVESNKTYDEMRKYQCNIYEHNVSKTKVNDSEIAGLDDEEKANYRCIKKCGYKIDMNKLKTVMPDLDDSKMEDENYIYQPFKKASQLVQKFDGQKGNRLLEEKDVDTVSSVSTKEQEKSIDLESINDIILSNLE